MTYLEWEKRVHDMCPCCRSREFHRLSQEDKDELIAEIERRHGIYEGVR